MLHRTALMALVACWVLFAVATGFCLWVVLTYPSDNTVRVLCTFIYVMAMGSFVKNMAELWREWRKPNDT